MSSRRQMLEFLSLSPQPTSYSASYSVTNGTLTNEGGGSLPTQVSSNDDISIILTPGSGYYIDSTGISVSGASYDFDARYVEAVGQYVILYIYDIVGNISINVSFTNKEGATRYSITYNSTNSSAGIETGEGGVGVPYIYEHQVAYGEVTYDYPDSSLNSFSATNVTYSFVDTYIDSADDSVWEIYLISNPTGNVVVTTYSEPDEPEPEEEEE